MKMKIFSLLFLSSIILGSCSKNNDDNNNNSTITTNDVKATLGTGIWRVSYYWDSDHEETANYNNYAFEFDAAGTVTATKTGVVVNGTWSVSQSSSSVKVLLGFATLADFAELSEDWVVTEKTNTLVKMKHESGGGGGTDYLNFEKVR